MPTYEYQCQDCGAVFDVFQSIKSRPLRKTACPECETSRPVKRLISTGGAVLFKGSGFYETDYRSESYKKAAKAETETTSSASKSDDKKSDVAKVGDKTGTKGNTADKPATKQKTDSSTPAKVKASA